MICTAHTTSGKPCRAPAITGGRVCQAHGGSAPQVRSKALARIQNLVPNSLDAVERNLECGNPFAELAAANSILDRAGFKPGESMNLTVEQGVTHLTLEDLDRLRAERIARASPGLPAGDPMTIEGSKPQ